MLESEGIKPTFVVAGKYKVENNPLEPMTTEGRAAWQSSVDETYREFLGAMARNRGVSLAKVRDEFGEGRTMSAPKAKAVGMIDRVDTMDGVLSRMRATATADPRYASNETALTSWLRDVWTSGRELHAASAGRVAVARARRLREREGVGRC
jgi:ClpP class serine protease